MSERNGKLVNHYGADASALRGKVVSLAVVLGSFNRLASLRTSLDSVRRCAGMPFTFIVVDGGSTDGTREYLASQPDVVLIGQRGPLTGAVRAFNLGFAYAVDEGFEFIGHFNDDAACQTEGMWARAVQMLEDDPSAAAVAFEIDLWNRWGFDNVHGKVYTNFGVYRAGASKAIACAQGDPTGRAFWNPIYRTYGADSEHGAWAWKLGYHVIAAKGLRVHDLQVKDAMREANEAGGPAVRPDSILFRQRWTSPEQLVCSAASKFPEGKALKIHVGCGQKHLRGWLNLDGTLTPAADAVLDLYQMQHVPSGVASWIYWSHGPEHIHPDKLPGVLRELKRILVTGGRLTVATIDLRGIWENRFVSQKNGGAWNAALYGETDSTHHPFLAHRQAFTQETLLVLMARCEFRNVRRWALAEYPEINDLNDYARSCALVTCYGEGIA